MIGTSNSRGKRGPAVLLAVALAVVSYSVAAADQQDSFTLAPTWVYDLFSFDIPGAENTLLTAINNHNAIAGTYVAGPVGRSFLISDGGFLEIAAAGASTTIIGDLNDEGTIVGSFQKDGRTEAFQFSSGTMSPVPFVPVTPLLKESRAESINNLGNIVGFYRIALLDLSQGFWFIDSSTLPANTPVALSGINDAGHVVGTSLAQAPDGTYKGFLAGEDFATWVSHASAAQTDPSDVNNHDTVVGRLSMPDDTSPGFVWANGKSVAIQYPGARWTEIRGINDAGIIVGAYSDDAGVHGLVGVPRSPVDVTVNGVDGPLTIARTGPLQVALAFDAPPTGTLEPSELYIALATPTGVLWLHPNGAWAAAPAPLLSGALPEFGPTALIDLETAAAVPPGTYTWLMLVDDDTNGVPNGVFFDSARITIQ